MSAVLRFLHQLLPWSELLTGREDARGRRQSAANERGKHAAEGAAAWRAAMKDV